MVIILCKRKEINKRNNKGEKKNKVRIWFFLAECKEEKGRKAFGHLRLILR